MIGLNVDVSIKFKEFLQEIYRIGGINSAEYELILRCLYNVKPLVSAFVISNQEYLQFFLFGHDVSQVVVLISKVLIPSRQSMSTLTSFTIPLAQKILNFRHLSQPSVNPNVQWCLE